MSNSPPALPTGLYPWLSEQWGFFRRCLDIDRLAHALIIEGPSGSGKTTLANAMVARLLCTEDQPVACGRCRSCELLAGGAHPEFIDITFEINPKTGNLRTVLTVNQIREMIGKLQLTTSISKRKVTLINPAECLHPSAANALLKSLEEPAGHDTVMILVTDSPGRLPVTIRSRCQLVSIHQPERELVYKWLQETSSRGDAEVSAAIDAAAGSPLRAAHFIESPELDAFKQVRESLAMLLSRPGAVSLVTATLEKLAADDVWRWLSACTSDVIKASMQGTTPEWIPANLQLGGKTLLQLQQQADMNRRFSGTQVRGDLLLQSWLISWAEQGI